MSIYNVNFNNRVLRIMLEVHEYLLKRSVDSEYINYEDLQRFYAAKHSGPYTCAKNLERVGIAYRALHPTRHRQGQPKALYFKDKGRLHQAVDQLRQEMHIRQTGTKRKHQKITAVQDHVATANLDNVIWMLAPKRRNDDVTTD